MHILKGTQVQRSLSTFLRGCVVVAAMLIATGSVKATTEEQSHRIDHLSPNAYATLMTISPGNELYSAFGHTAIHICDSLQGIDVVYNYGTFEFFDHFVYLKFARGTLPYCLSREDYTLTLYSYNLEGRAIEEQMLLLSSEELWNLFWLLEINNLPENRTYSYDFFRDNCATRVRDIVREASSEPRCHAFCSYQTDSTYTYRQLIHRYLDQAWQWSALGIDIVVGSRCDKVITADASLFIPERMLLAERAHTEAALRSPEKHQTPMTELPEETLNAWDYAQPAPITPMTVMLIVATLVAVATVVERHFGLNSAIIDVPLFTIAALASLTICFLWFASTHYCTKANWNLLWLNPLFIIIAIRPHLKSKLLWAVVSACEAMFIGLFWLLPQQFNAAMFPIAATLLLRTVLHLLPKKSSETNIHQ